MTSRLSIAIPLLLLEIGTTIATAHQHHSEARWEISAAYFGSVIGYVLVRLIIWLPLAIVLLIAEKRCWRSAPIGQLPLVALVLEVATTLGSILLREKWPPYGIFFGSFIKYLGARLVFWVPLALGSLIAMTRHSDRRARV